MSTPSYTFDSPDADVILRAPLRLEDPESIKFKDFHAHKPTLSAASTVFRNMFSLPQRDTNLSVVHVAEPAEVFETFLRLIYPIEPPIINSPQSVGHLFQLTSKYMADGVHAKLRQTLVSPSFLRNNPVWVYAVACRMKFDEETELAIRHTYQINLVQDIPLPLLRAMTTEMYNRLLRSHASRREGLITAYDKARSPPIGFAQCSCGPRLYEELYREMRLAIWEKPVLDRRSLDWCLSHIKAMPKSKCRLGTYCRVSTQTIYAFFARVLDGIEELDRVPNH
jgi:hypothetical protein